jgi:hypothetical protein
MADRAFYKNAQIYTTVRFALTLFYRIDLFLKENRGTVRVFEINQSNGLYFKYGTVRAFDFLS